jgi:hypothetical protein
MDIYTVTAGKRRYEIATKCMAYWPKSISSGGLHMSLYSKIWRFGAKIHLQQGL